MAQIQVADLTFFMAGALIIFMKKYLSSSIRAGDFIWKKQKGKKQRIVEVSE